MGIRFAGERCSYLIPSATLATRRRQAAGVGVGLFLAKAKTVSYCWRSSAGKDDGIARQSGLPSVSCWCPDLPRCLYLSSSLPAPAGTVPATWPVVWPVSIPLELLSRQRLPTRSPVATRSRRAYSHDGLPHPLDDDELDVYTNAYDACIPLPQRIERVNGSWVIN